MKVRYDTFRKNIELDISWNIVWIIIWETMWWVFSSVFLQPLSRLFNFPSSTLAVEMCSISKKLTLAICELFKIANFIQIFESKSVIGCVISL